MLLVAFLGLSLQLNAAQRAPAMQQYGHVALIADSIRDVAHAHGSQTAFERFRRGVLPSGYGNAGRCDVRLGRFCWWYDGSLPVFPPEKDVIKARRRVLLAELDASAAKYPGDNWLAGMRVHYRVEGRDFVAADSVARSCRAEAWWCAALVGYAAHAGGNAAIADSAFRGSLAAMPPDSACAWRSIAPLLSDDDRDAYEHLACEQRVTLDERFWTLSRPQFSSAANDFRNELGMRRVLTWLGARGTTPHLLPWGNDAAELVLRYGWPVAWSRQESSQFTGTTQNEGGVIGHDPSPSFVFTPARWRVDSLKPLASSDWTLDEPRAESRFAPRQVRRVVPAVAQLARFRRNDSTLVVAAFSAKDDSLLAVSAVAGASGAVDAPALSAPDTARTGTSRIMLAGRPLIAGVDIIDTTTRTLARMRQTFSVTIDSQRVSLSDLLMYRAADVPAGVLDSALARAIPGDTVTRTRAVGIFWETYGLVADGETLDIAVSVERVDHSWIRSARQRLGLTPVDTPIRIRWNDARPPSDRGAAHAISLDLANLDSGRYRVTLSVTPAGGTSVYSVREIELIDR